MSESLARTSAGIRLYANALEPATYNQVGYAALDWSAEIGEVLQVGEYGKNYSLITFSPLSDRRTHKRKGIYNSGSLALQMGRAKTDAGQAIMIAALTTDTPISFKIAFNSEGEVDYFVAHVMSYTLSIGDGNQILGSSASLELDGDVVEVDLPAPNVFDAASIAEAASAAVS